MKVTIFRCKIQTSKYYVRKSCNSLKISTKVLIEIECQENFHYSSELPILAPGNDFVL